MNTPQELLVLEEDMGADAVTFENLEEGVTYLFVRPGQSFESAVKSILRVCPEMTLPRVQDLVRKHCPNIREMNERLGADQNIPRFEAAPTAGVLEPDPAQNCGVHRRIRAPRWARIAAIAVPALVGGTLLAQLLQPVAAKPDRAPVTSMSQDDQVAAHTYRNPDFKKIADGGQMRCDPMGAYEAKCVDVDGKVMYSEASVGTSTAFTFSYDYEKIGFRIFPDEESAAAWSAEDGNKTLFQNVTRHGRVVLWGTDQKRLGEWQRSLEAGASGVPTPRGRALTAGLIESDRAGMALTGLPPEPGAAPASSPVLPDRLAFLAFGTLGVTEAAVQAAVEGGGARAVQLLQAVQLVLGSADPHPLNTRPAGPTDAVAIVLDATQPPPAVAEKQMSTHGTAGTVVAAGPPLPEATEIEDPSPEAPPVAPTPTTKPSTPVTPPVPTQDPKPPAGTDQPDNQPGTKKPTGPETPPDPPAPDAVPDPVPTEVPPPVVPAPDPQERPELEPTAPDGRPQPPAPATGDDHAETDPGALPTPGQETQGDLGLTPETLPAATGT